MIVSIHQPNYIPWLGFFHKIYLTDYYCYFDIAQYQNKDFNNRNLIKTNEGPIWLSVPVESKNHFSKKVGKIKIINNGWNKKHFRSISLAYKKSKFYDKYIVEIERILMRTKYDLLSDLNLEFIKFGLKALDIKTNIIIASENNFEGVKSDLVLDMCKKLGAKKYLFGSEGKNYANTESFIANDIKAYFQEYDHPEYDQLHGEFCPKMSFLDLIFNEGHNSLKILLKDNIKSL